MKGAFLGVYLSKNFRIIWEKINIAFYNFSQVIYIYAKKVLVPGQYFGELHLKPLLDPISFCLL